MSEVLATEFFMEAAAITAAVWALAETCKRLSATTTIKGSEALDLDNWVKGIQGGMLAVFETR
jgi:hypothetical protein